MVLNPEKDLTRKEAENFLIDCVVKRFERNCGSAQDRYKVYERLKLFALNFNSWKRLYSSKEELYEWINQDLIYGLQNERSILEWYLMKLIQIQMGM